MTDLTSELIFAASRSSGAGGQNINKVNTKVELRFNIAASALLTESQKERLLEKLAPRLTGGGDLLIVSQEERTQAANRERCLEKFAALLASALKTQKKRKATRPTRASKERRIDEKKARGSTKERRRPVD